MEDIQKVTNQTPIEIALGIDENGMTTARKLFDFLEMNVANYARWIKRNITNNEFAEENVDYFPFVIDDECEDNKKLFRSEEFNWKGKFGGLQIILCFCEETLNATEEREGRASKELLCRCRGQSKRLGSYLKTSVRRPYETIKTSLRSIRTSGQESG